MKMIATVGAVVALVVAKTVVDACALVVHEVPELYST